MKKGILGRSRQIGYDCDDIRLEYLGIP